MRKRILNVYNTYPQVMWMLSVALVISATGESFLWPLTTTYIVHVFGKSLQAAAAVLMLQYSGSLIGNVVGGILFDRWSGRKTVITAIAASILLLIVMGSIPNFGVYIILLFLLGMCNGTFWPSTRAFAAVLWPEGGRLGMNMLYVANNLGVAIGASIGGLIASYSFRYAFFGNAVTYVLFLVLFMMSVKAKYLRSVDTVPSDKKTRSEENASIKHRESILHWISLGILITGFMLLVVTYSQWQTTISTYVSSIGIPLSSYSMLWGVNGISIVVCQPILTWLIRRLALSLKVQILLGSCMFGIAMLVVSLSSLYVTFVLGMVIITWGEMLVWPAVPTIVAEMAPQSKEGFYQGIATTGQSVGRMIGPLFGGFIYESFSPHTMLSTMIALAFAALCCFFYFDLVRRSKPNAQPVGQTTA